MKILLIEPDRLLATNCRLALEQAGHSVNWQARAQSAIHQADTEQPDAIVLELQLPAHSGIEFLYELRSYPDWQNIPVIIHSLVPQEAVVEDMAFLKNLGVKHFLYKPQTKLRQLVAAVNRLQPIAT